MIFAAYIPINKLRGFTPHDYNERRFWCYTTSAKKMTAAPESSGAAFVRTYFVMELELKIDLETDLELETEFVTEFGCVNVC